MPKESKQVHVNWEEALYAVGSGGMIGLGIGTAVFLDAWPLGVVMGGYGIVKSMESMDGAKHVRIRTRKEKSSLELVKE
jgi:hypothetical protein